MAIYAAGPLIGEAIVKREEGGEDQEICIRL